MKKVLFVFCVACFLAPVSTYAQHSNEAPVVNNQHGYDQHGYNQQGYNQQGYDRHGYNQHGYDRHGRKRQHD